MNKFIIAAAVIVALGLSAVLAKPQVTISGEYIPISNPNMTYDVAHYELDGPRAGRHVSIEHTCFDGATVVAHKISHVYWHSGTHADANFGVYVPVTHCTGVALDVDHGSGSSVEISNTVIVTP